MEYPFRPREEREKLDATLLANIPWPLREQYESVHKWMDQKDPVSALTSVDKPIIEMFKIWQTRSYPFGQIGVPALILLLDFFQIDRKLLEEKPADLLHQLAELFQEPQYLAQQ